jgi:hypothetical protein
MGARRFSLRSLLNFLIFKGYGYKKMDVIGVIDNACFIWVQR